MCMFTLHHLVVSGGFEALSRKNQQKCEEQGKADKIEEAVELYRSTANSKLKSEELLTL